MGAKACDRKSCSNVLCDRLLHLGPNCYLYICEDCLKDLKIERARWPSEMTIEQIHEAIEEFMASPVEPPDPQVVLNAVGIEEEFQRIIGG